MKALITAVALLVVLGLAYFLYSAPTAPAEMTEAEIAQIEAAAEAVGDQWLADLINLDVDAHAAALDPSSMHGNDGATYYSTYDEWVTHVENLFGNFEEITGEWTNTRVDVLASDAALFVGQNDCRVKRVSGALSRMQGSVSLVVRNVGGEWMVTHQSSVGRWTAIEEG